MIKEKCFPLHQNSTELSCRIVDTGKCWFCKESVDSWKRIFRQNLLVFDPAQPQRWTFQPSRWPCGVVPGLWLRISSRPPSRCESFSQRLRRDRHSSNHQENCRRERHRRHFQLCWRKHSIAQLGDKNRLQKNWHQPLVWRFQRPKINRHRSYHGAYFIYSDDFDKTIKPHQVLLCT